MEPDIKEDFISHRKFNSEKYQSKADKRNRLLEIIDRTYYDSWRLERPRAIFSQKKMIDVETQHAKITISSHNHQSVHLDDKAVIGIDIKQRSRDNSLTPAKNELNINKLKCFRKILQI